MNSRCETSVVEKTFEAVELGSSQDPVGQSQNESTESVRRRFAKLSLRERQVMLLIASGLLNKQVAFKLGISLPTVKFHRSAVMRKMEADSLAALVWMAAALDAPAARLRIVARASGPLAEQQLG